eukprot:233190-Hanusia_phi.AAC.4
MTTRQGNLMSDGKIKVDHKVKKASEFEVAPYCWLLPLPNDLWRSPTELGRVQSGRRSSKRCCRSS